MRIASRVSQFIIINAHKSFIFPLLFQLAYILNHSYPAAIKEVQDAPLKQTLSEIRSSREKFLINLGALQTTVISACINEWRSMKF